MALPFFCRAESFTFVFYFIPIIKYCFMAIYPMPTSEIERLEELFHYQILDSGVEEEFEDIVKIVAKAFGVPVAAINLLDAKRQWVKAQTGLHICDINMDKKNSVCNYTILQDAVLEVEDLQNDGRFNTQSYVVNAPLFRYYAGVPLVSKKGYHIGALCILDHEPRRLEKDDHAMLLSFARTVITQMEIRLQNIELQHRTAMQTRLASALSHDIKGPLSNVKMMLDMQEEIDGREASPESKVVNKLLRKGVDNTIEMVNNMIQWGTLQLNNDNEVSVFNLKETVDESLNEVYNSNTAKYNALINAVPENMVLKGDALGIRFVLRNLLTNACKFTHKGTITVSCETVGGEPVLQVKDTGMGMSPETTARLNRKQRITHTNGTHDETGHGLGLGLVQEYLARREKELFFQSMMGIGTAVSFAL